MSIFDNAKNPRSKALDKHIDCDVFIDGRWLPYTTTPTDHISGEAYLMLKARGNISIAPTIYHDWVDGKWVDASSRYKQILDSVAEEKKTAKLKELTYKIDALSDKINLGMSTNIDEDNSTLLSLRKERALLM